MKKVRYEGQNEVILHSYGIEVKNGDVIEVEDDFFNAQFSDVKEKPQKDGGKE